MKSIVEQVGQTLYVKTKISDEDLCEIKSWSSNYLKSESLKITYNHRLAGAIENEFLLPTDIEQKVKPYALKLLKNFNLNIPIHTETCEEYEVLETWINFQKKYEYNPFHIHVGEYSFVLWVNIPYDLNEELNLPNCIKTSKKKNSLFEFEYYNFEGQINSDPIMVDKSFEGTMILFPSKMRHCVYPFYTSDDYRISISGNLTKKINKSSVFHYE